MNDHLASAKCPAALRVSACVCVCVCVRVRVCGASCLQPAKMLLDGCHQ